MPIETNDRYCERQGQCTLGGSVDELVEEFEALDDWDDRYQLILELGDELPELPEAYKTDANRVEGCMSTVWLVANVHNGDQTTIDVMADSDSQIVRGLIAILTRIYAGRTPQEILDCDIHCLFDRLQLKKHLSATRRNGLHAMINRIRALAVEHA